MKTYPRVNLRPENRVPIQGIRGVRRIKEQIWIPRENIRSMMNAFSIGVATTPPESRTMDVEACAEDRKRQAKAKGKNRVVGN